eukprot:TRINITY_DN66103_c0_g1_i1.p1 TRINITY_DN66103_c0_g1~~TRINITY_DN66103_c0_g1_i1.p1  ORF type:complete len:643 (-),score=108.81 TRINITY_DN66103_c0_g1_i1:120-1922(-)
MAPQELRRPSELARMLDFSRSELTIGELIGRGRFKQVHAGCFRTRDVVVMRYHSGSEQEDNELQILQHLACMGARAATFVPEVFGICAEDADSKLVVQERAHHGSLRMALKDGTLSLRLTPGKKLVAAAQLSRAMEFLQECRIVHADLSCRNVLLCHLGEEDDMDDDVLVKVTDFGLALVLEPGSESIVKRQPQCTRWCAPETVAHMQLSHRSDVWSLGATLWETFSGGGLPWQRLEKRLDVAVRLKRLAAVVSPPNDSAAGGATASKSPRYVRGSPRSYTSSADELLTADFPQPAAIHEAAHGTVLLCLKSDPAARLSFAEVTAILNAVIASGVCRCRNSAEVLGEAKCDESDTAASGASTASGYSSFDGCGTSPSTAGTPASQSMSVPLDSCLGPLVASGDCGGVQDSSTEAAASCDLLASPESIEADARKARECFLLDVAERRAAAAAAECLLARATSKVGRRSSKRRSWSSHHQLEHGGLEHVDIRERSPLGSAWTLWSHAAGNLCQEFFCTEADARAAFEVVCSLGHPCALDDPSGERRDSQAWFTLPAQHIGVYTVGPQALEAAYVVPEAPVYWSSSPRGCGSHAWRPPLSPRR